MSSTQPERTGFFSKLRWIIPYVFVFNGVIFILVGGIFAMSAVNFTSGGVAAELRVIAVDTRRSDNGFVYRPVFEAVRDSGQPLRFAGNLWVSPKPHNTGDVVPGIVNWDAGKMRSNAMLSTSKTLGTIFVGAGVVALVSGGGLLLRRRRRKANEV